MSPASGLPTRGRVVGGPCRRGPIPAPVPLLRRPGDGPRPRGRAGSRGPRNAGRRRRLRGGRSGSWGRLPQSHAWNGKPPASTWCCTRGTENRSSRAVAVPGRRTATALWVPGHPRGSIGRRDAPQVWYATNCICALDRAAARASVGRASDVILPQVLHRHCCGNGSTRTPRSMLSATTSTVAPEPAAPRSRPSSVPCCGPRGERTDAAPDGRCPGRGRSATGSTQLATRQMRPSRSAVWPGSSPKRICEAPRSTLTTGLPASRRRAPVARRRAGTASACRWGRAPRPIRQCWRDRSGPGRTRARRRSGPGAGSRRADPRIEHRRPARPARRASRTGRRANARAHRGGLGQLLQPGAMAAGSWIP